MFKRHHIHFNEKTGKGSEPSGIRYLYCGLTGARFARSSRTRHTDDTETPHRAISATSAPYNLPRPDPPAETPADNNTQSQPPQPDSAPVLDSTPSQTIARLTAERDAARYERELEADYREALLRNHEVLSSQLKGTQRRLMDLEQAAHPAGQAPEPPGARERQLEHELDQARSRISELEATAALTPTAPLPRGQEGMMDVFLQFVGLQERHDDSRT